MAGEVSRAAEGDDSHGAVGVAARTCYQRDSRGGDKHGALCWLQERGSHGSCVGGASTCGQRRTGEGEQVARLLRVEGVVRQ